MKRLSSVALASAAVLAGLLVGCKSGGGGGSGSTFTCSITAPAQDLAIQVGQSVSYTGQVSNGTGPFNFNWSFPGGVPPTASLNNTVINTHTVSGVTYLTPGTFTTAFSATDGANRSCTASRRVTVLTRQLSGISINSTSQNRGPNLNLLAVTEQPLPGTAGSGLSGFQIVAVNDLGMHCGDLDTRIASILPPFNVVHAQVLSRGQTPVRLDNRDVQVSYSAASSPQDAALTRAPTLATNGNVFKTNFWDVARAAYDPFYPPGVLPSFYPVGAVILDIGLPVPDLERLFLGDLALVAAQQGMPSVTQQNLLLTPPFVTAPYQANQPQTFARFDQDLPFFVDFPFGYTAAVDWFAADGIPTTPFDDFGRENAFPLMRIQARAVAGNGLAQPTGTVLASLDTVLPVSGESDCKNCHAAPEDGGNGLAITGIQVATAFSDPQFGEVPLDVSIEWATDRNILRQHDRKHGTALGTGLIDASTGVAADPVVCQRCHYSPALDLAHAGPTDVNGREQSTHESMSRVMHEVHGQFQRPDGNLVFPVMPPPTDTRRSTGTPVNSFEQTTLEASCYQCHPGKNTQCMRGAMFNAGIVCQDCHGQMTQVGDDFSRNLPGGTFLLGSDFYNPASATPRVPWANEPGCGSCHTGDVLSNLAGNPGTVVSSDGLRLIQAYRTGDVKATPIVPTNKRFAEPAVSIGPAAGTGNPQLYRVSTGHGGVFCEACHGSTHAEWPVKPDDPAALVMANDNQTALQLQGHTGTVTECSTCHDGADLGITLDGPHGLHPVGDTRFADGGHESLAESNPNACRACHGQNGEGTVLSRAAVDRTLPDVGFVARGTPIHCGMCHGNPL